MVHSHCIRTEKKFDSLEPPSLFPFQFGAWNTNLAATHEFENVWFKLAYITLGEIEISVLGLQKECGRESLRWIVLRLIVFSEILEGIDLNTSDSGLTINNVAVESIIKTRNCA